MRRSGAGESPPRLKLDHGPHPAQHGQGQHSAGHPLGSPDCRSDMGTPNLRSISSFWLPSALICASLVATSTWEGGEERSVGAVEKKGGEKERVALKS